MQPSTPDPTTDPENEEMCRAETSMSGVSAVDVAAARRAVVVGAGAVLSIWLITIVESLILLFFTMVINNGYIVEWLLTN